MQIGEQVAMVMVFMDEDKTPLCDKKEESENNGWKCRVGKNGDPGDLGVPTAKRLYDNMVSDGAWIPSKPKKISRKWDLDKCNATTYPFQSHHLIPKMHLPDHDVCVWLAKKAASSEWELTESTNYDTDDARNGQPLPFASTTYQWNESKNLDPASKETEQSRICSKMMQVTKKQLHQGQHTKDDFGEQDNLHADEEPGYLGAVDQLLKVVNGQTLNHVVLCPECKKSTSPPKKVRPLPRVVLAMHQVSSAMEAIINSKKRFVSKRAAEYWQIHR